MPVASAPIPSPSRSFPGLEGHEYRYDGARWKRCEGCEEYADYLEAEAKRRNFYRKVTTRNGAEFDMKRGVKASLDVLTTTFAPWLSAWTSNELRLGRDPRPYLARVRNGWLEAASDALQDQRYILGYALHADTDDLHFDLAVTRQDGLGGRIGQAGFGLCGPWVAGVDRQVRSGATISREKEAQFKRSLANFSRRYGDEVLPLDRRLNRALDLAAEQVVGHALVPFRDAYAASVPEMERMHAEARLDALEEARERILRACPSASPSFDVHDGSHIAPSHDSGLPEKGIEL